MTPLEKSPCVRSMQARVMIFVLPSDCPTIVTLTGSPPKRLILSRSSKDAALGLGKVGLFVEPYLAGSTSNKASTVEEDHRQRSVTGQIAAGRGAEAVAVRLYDRTERAGLLGTSH